ncbi:hypothetical protein [Sphingomonas sp. NFX23]|uniref:hypothetical protein n=1 Tax=Sphingomonas sp. NFX23 TaxID=2819532 RepID=UPI003CF5412C
MAHAKLNLSRMYDWIERNRNLDVVQPTDADIMQLFGFDSPESARTLLAELADAGRITIKGYGESRTIALGRIKSELTPAPRPMPSAKRADPVVDAGIAKIAAIVARGGNAGTARAVQAAAVLKSAQLKQTPSTPRPTKAVTTRPVPVPPIKEPVKMPAKPARTPAPAATPIPPFSPPAAVFALDTLFDMIRERFDERPDQSAELAAAIERAEATERRAKQVEERAKSAEAKLAQMKALFA